MPVNSYRRNAQSSNLEKALLLQRLLAQIRAWLPPTIFIALLLVGWHFLVTIMQWPAAILPGPLQVFEQMVAEANIFWSNTLATLYAILIGFGLAIAVAIPLAIAMVYSKLLYRAVYPVLVLSQVIPKVAIAPLLIIWFGFGDVPKVLMVTLIAFFPLVINAMVGFLQARPQSLMLVRSMGASRWQAFWRIRWPWALPNLFAGAKVGITLAVVGAVVAEFVGSDRGLGVLLMVARGNFDGTMAFAAIGWLAAIGLILFSLVSVIERAATPKGARGQNAEIAGQL